MPGSITANRDASPFGGRRADDAIEENLLHVVGPGAIAATVAAHAEANQRRDQIWDALLRDLEAARYNAERAFQQYDVVDPAELEARYIEAKIATHDAAVAPAIVEPTSLASLGADLKSVWTSPATDARLKKRIVRTLIQEIVADIAAAPTS